MSQRMLDERTIYVENTPMMPVYPDRPEPVRREPKVLDRKHSAKHLGLSVEDFNRVCTRTDFPASRLIPSLLPGDWNGDKPGWRDTELERWRDGKLAERDELIRMFPIK